MKRDSCAGLEWQCKSRKASLCNASNRRKCSANPKLKQVHCRFPQKLQCKSQIKAGALHIQAESAVQITNQSKCTAKVRRKCSTEPGNKQVHCTCKPEVQYRTRKISKCTARASPKPHPRNINCIPTSKVLPSTHSLSQYAIVTSSCVRSVNSGWRTAVWIVPPLYMESGLCHS